MTTEPVRVIIRAGHQAVGDAPDYHEWIFDRPVSCDRLGRRRPESRAGFSGRQRWVCNNPDCPAEAVVSNAAIQQLIEEAS